MKNWLLPAAALLGLILAACASPKSHEAETAYFEEHVKPVFQANCLRCHQGPQAPARLDLSNGRSALAAVSPRTKKPFIIPGFPSGSLIIAAVTRWGTHPQLMPRLDVSLTEDEIGELTEWIEDGAYWPKDERGNLRPTFNPENP